MDLKLGQAWLTSVNGLLSALLALFTTIGLVFAAVENLLAPWLGAIGLAETPSRIVTIALVVPLLWWVWRGYRRFARQSRLEQPEYFTLSAESPDQLKGRDQDVQRLLQSVKRNRIVLLDGESGCGKSALLTVGLVPQLRKTDGFLPVLLRDWGDNWIRGPLASLLDALHEALSDEERKQLLWEKPPDLAASGDELVKEVSLRLDAVCGTLKRHVVLIADQFDDYQAQHHDEFLTDDGAWLLPDALASRNAFWSLVRRRLDNGSMHMLAVTRDDTASGFSCIRFLDPSMTADRKLLRVDVAYLRPVLSSVAPAGKDPPVVSNPEAGWYDLRDRLEDDLRTQGAILMQQVRTVLLGLRRLPVLTLSSYRAAGGLRGMEMLVIAHAVEAAGGKQARAVLEKLVQSSAPNQQPKARRCTLADLEKVVGQPARTAAILRSLQDEGVIRPAGGAAPELAWQLDHDYLVHAVLAEARQADRWGEALRLGLKHYHDATGNWWQRWAALLPIWVQARVAWERIRGRVTYGEAASYARRSLAKPVLLLMVLALSGIELYKVHGDRLLTQQATAIHGRFGYIEQDVAVLDAWRAPEKVRQRIYEDVMAEPGLLQRATGSRWPLAHGGWEASRLKEAAALLATRLKAEHQGSIVASLSIVYGAVAQRLEDEADLKQAAELLRMHLEEQVENETDTATDLADSYAAVAHKLVVQDDIRSEAVALRTKLADPSGSHIAGPLTTAYVAVAQKLGAQDDVKAEVVALRAKLTDPSTGFYITKDLATAYVAAAQKLVAQDDIRSEAVALRTRLKDAPNSYYAEALANSYVAVIQKLVAQSDIKAEVIALRTQWESHSEFGSSRVLTEAYSAVAEKLVDQEDIKATAIALRARLERESETYAAKALAVGYAALAEKLVAQSDIKSEADELRVRLESNSTTVTEGPLCTAYAAVAAKLVTVPDIRAATIALRAKLEAASNDYDAEVIGTAYAAVVEKLVAPDDIKAEADKLRARLEGSSALIMGPLLTAYASVAGRLEVEQDIKAIAMALRTQLEREDRNWLTKPLVAAYGAVAQKLVLPDDIKDEADALLKQLEDNNRVFLSPLATAYATVAPKMVKAGDLKTAAMALRTRLENADASDAEPLAMAYAAVAQGLLREEDLAAEALALRTRLEAEAEPHVAAALATAYATVVRREVEIARGNNAKRDDLRALVAETLTMAGHPFLTDAAPLLASLEPLAGKPFDGNPLAAVHWWVEDFKGDPATLRP